MTKNISCIYQIRNIINGHLYIGSAVNFISRKYKHLHELRKNKHRNLKLQRSYNKYGENNFIFEILEIVKNKQDLINVEQKFIDSVNPFYNICRVASSRLGVKASNETIQKMKLSKLNQSEETKNKISETLKLKKTKKTQEQKDNISFKLKGRIITEEHRLKIKNSLIEYWKNGDSSNNHKEIISKNNVGNKYSFGKKMSEKQKKQISINKKTNWVELKSKGIMGKKINQFDLSGNFIRTWDYISDAAKKLNIDSSAISACCRGKYKNSGGFIWKYFN